MRGGTSRAGRTGCCAVLRVLVAGERWRGRLGRGWGSVGGLVPSQGQCGLPAFASGASFWSWYPWMGCLVLARTKFWVPGAFSAPQSAPLTQSSPRKLTSAPRALSLTTTLYAAQRPPSCREYVSRLRPASLQPRCPARGLPGVFSSAVDGQKSCSAKIRFARLRGAPAPFGAAAGGTPLVARPALPAICEKRHLPRTSNRCSG